MIRPNTARVIPSPPILVISDRHQARQPLVVLARALFEAGCRWFLLRDKDLPFEERLALSTEISEEAAEFGATFLISADMRIKNGEGIGGVHVPSDLDPGHFVAMLGPGKRVGFSAHSLADVRFADARCVDYVTLSPIFPSESKPDYGPHIGLKTLKSVTELTEMPVIALGGVTTGNVRDCIVAGAAGIAVMGEVMRAEDPAAVFSALNRQVGMNADNS